VRAQVDLGDRLVELLIRRDRAVARREERVVGVAERLAGANVSALREAPDDPLRPRVDEDDPVVVAVGDQHVAPHRAPFQRRQPERPLGRRRRLPSGSDARRARRRRVRRRRGMGIRAAAGDDGKRCQDDHGRSQRYG
jgi:hypothetical protein